jgi:hypothetical protein
MTQLTPMRLKDHPGSQSDEMASMSTPHKLNKIALA